MKEVLFRIKNHDEWYYGYPISEIKHSKEVGDYVSFMGNAVKDGSSYYDLFAAADTLGEYTGLKDRNGKKIFEGDIVKCYRYANGKDGELVFENLVVVWDDMNACFALAEVGAGHISYRYNEYEMDDTHEFEVIGNIKDNPELLEK